MKILTARDNVTRRGASISRNSRLWLGLFFSILVLFGGSAQFARLADIPVRIAAAATIAFVVAAGATRAVRLRPLERWLIVLIFLIPLSQLVPLPPQIWTLLGDRTVYAVADRLIDPNQMPWRPISVDPDRSLDSLMFLLPPAACFLLGRTLDRSRRALVLALITTAGGVSGIVGIAQMTGGETSPLRFYATSSLEGPIGFFANRNHFALFLSVVIAFGSWFAGATIDRRGRITARLLWVLGSVAALSMIVATESRAGIVIGVVTIVTCPFLFFNFRTVRERSWALAALTTGAAVVLGAAFLIGSLAARFGRLAHDNPRADILPRLVLVARNNLPFGSGAGSFEHVYPRYETVSELVPSYWNHAHNDLLQLIIESGVLGLVALTLFGWWWISLLRAALWGQISEDRRLLLRLVLFVTGIVLLHSLVDYPLRTALMSGLFAFLCGVGGRLATARRAAGR